MARAGYDHLPRFMSGFYGWGAWNHGGPGWQGGEGLRWKRPCAGRTREEGGREREKSAPSFNACT